VAQRYERASKSRQPSAEGRGVKVLAISQHQTACAHAPRPPAGATPLPQAAGAASVAIRNCGVGEVPRLFVVPIIMVSIGTAADL
jgi:hypothetical protein